MYVLRATKRINLIADTGAKGEPGDHAAATAHGTAAVAAAGSLVPNTATAEHAVSGDNNEQAPPVGITIGRRLHTCGR